MLTINLHLRKAVDRKRNRSNSVVERGKKSGKYVLWIDQLLIIFCKKIQTQLTQGTDDMWLRIILNRIYQFINSLHWLVYQS